MDDDPDDTYEEKYVIPVRYDQLYNCCHIPPDEYRNCMADDVDVGIDKEEIDLIQKLMTCLETHKDTIDKYIDVLSRRHRKKES